MNNRKRDGRRESQRKVAEITEREETQRQACYREKPRGGVWWERGGAEMREQIVTELSNMRYHVILSETFSKISFTNAFLIKVSDRSLWWIRKDINHTFPS